MNAHHGGARASTIGARMVSTFCAHSFGILVVSLYVALLLWLSHVARVRPGPGLGAGVVLAAWLSLTSARAPLGTHLDADAVLALTGVSLFGAVAAGLSRALGPVLDRTGGGWLVGFQGFRVVLALLLWRLAAEGLLPHRVSVGGMSLDLATGALAPVVAWLSFRERTLADRWLLAFHGLGLALVSVVLGEVLLTVSTRADAALSTTPFLWLPTFVIPLAVFAHIASLRQILRERWRRGLA